MTDWRKYEVPDWVVDDYNSRVSEKDRMPLGGCGADDSYDSHVKIPMTKYGSYQKGKKETEEYDYSNLVYFIFLILCFLVWAIVKGLR